MKKNRRQINALAVLTAVNILAALASIAALCFTAVWGFHQNLVGVTGDGRIVFAALLGVLAAYVVEGLLDTFLDGPRERLSTAGGRPSAEEPADSTAREPLDTV